MPRHSAAQGWPPPRAGRRGSQAKQPPRAVRRGLQRLISPVTDDSPLHKLGQNGEPKWLRIKLYMRGGRGEFNKVTKFSAQTRYEYVDKLLVRQPANYQGTECLCDTRRTACRSGGAFRREGRLFAAANIVWRKPKHYSSRNEHPARIAKTYRSKNMFRDESFLKRDTTTHEVTSAGPTI